MKRGVAWTVDRDWSLHCMLHIPRRTRVGRSLWSRDSKWRPPSIPKNGRMPQAKSGARAALEAAKMSPHRDRGIVRELESFEDESQEETDDGASKRKRAPR